MANYAIRIRISSRKIFRELIDKFLGCLKDGLSIDIGLSGDVDLPAAAPPETPGLGGNVCTTFCPLFEYRSTRIA